MRLQRWIKNFNCEAFRVVSLSAVWAISQVGKVYPFRLAFEYDFGGAFIAIRRHLPLRLAFVSYFHKITRWDISGAIAWVLGITRNHHLFTAIRAVRDSFAFNEGEDLPVNSFRSGPQLSAGF